MAYHSPFRLGASIFTADLAEAREASEGLKAGMVWINNPMIGTDALPVPDAWLLGSSGRKHVLRERHAIMPVACRTADGVI